MYTVICGKDEGFTFSESDTYECVNIDEVDTFIHALRHEGFRIFIVRKDDVDVARIDDIAAAINAHTREIARFREAEG